MKKFCKKKVIVQLLQNTMKKYKKCAHFDYVSYCFVFTKCAVVHTGKNTNFEISKKS